MRSTQPNAQGAGGRGISIEPSLDTAALSTATVRATVVEQSHDLGVFVAGSEVTVEGTVVRGTQPAQGVSGRGINIRHHPYTDAPSIATVRASVVEQNHELGVFVGASEVTVEGTVVRGTQPDAQGLSGRGIGIQPHPNTGAPSTVTVRASLVEQNHDIGVFIAESEAIIEGCHITATQPNGEGRFGDGLAYFRSSAAPVRVFVDNTRIDDSARAGLSNFGGIMSLRAVSIGCAKWQLEGEPLGDNDFEFENLGDNACGCPEVNGECVAVSAGLEPPEPIEPIE